MTGHSTTGHRMAGNWVASIVATAMVLATMAPVAAEPKAGKPEASQGHVLIEDAWVRAMPPSQPNTAAYMRVRNTGNKVLRIVSASSQREATVEIHTSREVDGMVRMEQLEGITLKAGELAHFAPGGMHLMVLGLKSMPAPGEQLKLCLQFESGGSACADAEVRRLAPSPDDKKHQNHQHH